jgi:predicted amidophosphoribosyltransferase
MKTSGPVCSECRAGFRRIELCSSRGTAGEYRCPLCNNLIEKLDGERLIAYRLTIIPPKYLGAQSDLQSCSAC